MQFAMITMKLIIVIALITIPSIANATDINTTSTSLQVGEITIQLPISMSFIGAIQCINTKQCGTTVGSAYWSVASLAAVVVDINNNPNLEYFHNLTFDIYDTIRTGQSSIQLTVTAASDSQDLALLGMADSCLVEATVAGLHDKMGVSDGCNFDETTAANVESDYVQMSRSYRLALFLILQYANLLKLHIFATAILELLNTYGWSQVVVISPITGMDWFYTAGRDQMLTVLRANNISIIADIRITPTDATVGISPASIQYAKTIANTYLIGRIFIIFDPTPNSPLVRWTSFVMNRMGLLATGEYFIISAISEIYNRQWIDLSDLALAIDFGVTNTTNNGTISSSIIMPTIDELMQTYRALLIVSDMTPPSWTSTQWSQYQQRIMQIYANPPCPPLCGVWKTNASPPTTSTSTNKYWGDTARLYDSIQLLALAGTQMINVGADLTSGAQYFEYMINRQYQSITGMFDYIDETGQAQGTLQLQYFYNDTIRGYSMWPIGFFGFTSLVDNTWLLPIYYIQDLSYYSNAVPINWIGGHQPSDHPICGFNGQLCMSQHNRFVMIICCVVGGILIILLIIALFLYRQYRYERQLLGMDWLIDRKDIVLKRFTNLTLLSLKSIASGLGESMASIGASAHQMRNSHYLLHDYDAANELNPEAPKRKKAIIGENGVNDAEESKWLNLSDFGIGLYQGNTVALKRVWKSNIDLSREVRKEILHIRELSHDNILPFKGIVMTYPHVFIVSELCARGSLKDILENDEFELDPFFLASISIDIVKGMDYLHNSKVGYHGRLKSSNCLIDGRWTVHLSSFGLRHFRNNESPDIDGVQEGRDSLWTSPELLRVNTNLAMFTDLLIQKNDVYSFAILLYEIYGRAGPWGDDAIEPKDIILRVTNPPKNLSKPYRPDLKTISDAPSQVKETCAACWAENADERPTFPMIRQKLKILTKGMKKSVMENMVNMMEKYTEKLESIINERTVELQEERKKSERLLKLMLPESVADSLKLGNSVQAESFPSVTVYFSDVVGFVEMASKSAPTQVVAFLNDLYTCFDKIIDTYDVYKVETIGDSYMVVSGLPIQNGPNHAGEIASMSLNLLEAVKKFKIRHRPNDIVQLRIGMHSGPCVAGVVGLRMPRYCLFGDTVNTASRMESNGIPLKINCSMDSKSVLDEIGGYEIIERGLVAMKGKGDQMTYFVAGQNNAHRTARILREMNKYPTLKNTIYQYDGQMDVFNHQPATTMIDSDLF